MCLRYRLLVLCFLPGIFAPQLGAQTNSPAPDYQEQLNRLRGEVRRPTESYREVDRSRNDLLSCPLAFRSRKHRLEIRLALEPVEGGQVFPPMVMAGRLAAHLASNEGPAPITVLRLGDHELTAYGADWGKVFYFSPKKSFSTRRHCELIALYRHGAGMAYTLLLFDKSSPELLRREKTFRFRE